MSVWQQSENSFMLILHLQVFLCKGIGCTHIFCTRCDSIRTLQDLLKLKDLETSTDVSGKVCHFVHGHKLIGRVRHQDNRPGNC
jgi:hypothetical protein